MHPTSVIAGIQHGEVARSEGHHLKGLLDASITPRPMP
ncbi:Hypothetical protein P9303_17411 [Prochlorococcus marinus str. MIT 9303]|uniref:Uncharacterized protein n=1 Tax=Prochlorococcus marinus (strain MIT 9303) TaxID=59922 RepID=A2CAH3_PROM3|nr:Hypothetical protein P9303_17411 [Prochlorococcus marinus str. MIT 9303]